MSRILLVDDVPEFVEAEKEILKEYDPTFDIETLSDPESALEVLGQRSFDLVILDIVMPQKDGLELLREIKAKYDLPVIIYSAYVDLYPPADLLEQGASCVISKPANLEFLIQCIREL